MRNAVVAGQLKPLSRLLPVLARLMPASLGRGIYRLAGFDAGSPAARFAAVAAMAR